MVNFSWSYSAISDFNICPKQYAAKRYYKSVQFEQTTQIIWGNRLHKAAELLAKGQQTEDAECVIILRPYLDDYLNRPHTELLVEKQLCINQEWKPTCWRNSDAWGRGIVDLGILDGPHCLMVDWKSGKTKYDDYQFKIFAVLMAIHYPELETFTGEFVWLKDGIKNGMPRTTRKELLPIIIRLKEQISTMQNAWNNESFPAKRNGLCRNYCPLKDCKYNG